MKGTPLTPPSGVHVSPLISKLAGVVDNGVEDVWSISVDMMTSTLHVVHVHEGLRSHGVHLLPSAIVHPGASPVDECHRNATVKLV